MISQNSKSSCSRLPQGKASLGLLIGFSLTILVALTYLASWPDHLELKLLDLRHKYYPLVKNHPDVVMLVIDDTCLKQVGQWPWRREIMAEMVNTCRQLGARQVVLDIVMPEEQKIYLDHPGLTDVSRYEPKPQIIGNVVPQPVDNDQAFADAISQCPNGTLPFHASFDDDSASSHQQGKTDYNLYVDEILPLVENDPEISFESVFYTFCPYKNIVHRDSQYQMLLQSYIRCVSLEMLRRFGFTREDDPVAVPVLTMRYPTPPIPLFAQAISNCGFVNVIEDKDGHVRRMSLLGRYRGRYYKQLAFAAACRALGVDDQQIDLSRPDRITLTGADLEIPLENGDLILAWADRADTWNYDHCLPVTDVVYVWDLEKACNANLAQLGLIDELTFQLSTVPDDLSSLDEPTRQLIDEKRKQLASLEGKEELLAANQDIQAQLEPARQKLRDKLNDKIILVGSIATAAPDFSVTPLGATTPGVMVHRNVLNTILSRTFIHRPSRWIEIAIILILGFAMTVVSASFRPLASGLVLAGLIVSAYIVNFRIAFAHFHYWFAVAMPLVAVLVSFTGVTFYRQITEGKARRLVTTRFKQYTSPAVVDQIVRSGSTVSFAGETRQLTCFFSDLAGFTSISERLGPQDTVAVLNIYLDRMTESLDRYDATVNKFQGDGIFAFFGAPIELPEHSKLACRAAIDSQIELGKLVQQQRQNNPDFPPLSMRVGISTGEVVVGDCGSHRRFDYTAIGDTVNLASRLEGANKPFGTRIMICEHVYQAVQDELAARYLGKVRVVGKDIPVGVYELIDRIDLLSDSQKRYNELFHRGVELYQTAKITDALDAFEACLKIRPDDKAASFYLKTTQPLAGRPLPKTFDGAVELTSK